MQVAIVIVLYQLKPKWIQVNCFNPGRVTSVLASEQNNVLTSIGGTL